MLTKEVPVGTEPQDYGKAAESGLPPQSDNVSAAGYDEKKEKADKKKKADQDDRDKADQAAQNALNAFKNAKPMPSFPAGLLTGGR
ncbi:MAG TPA: hypothetical protein VLX29_05375 [Nitrospirota bacterium]|nr:hypothetical protein [Nitrospirota bacterium]